ncbi:MAG: hypothetical protein HC869_13210, partial [Rhodospirillales bacterium]|nr:hypothetical protein [Rhodospirillales bacterium]
MFEFLGMWVVLYVFLIIAPDRRFMVHAAVLFCLAAGLTALAQTAAIWPELLPNTMLGIPFFADEFLEIKKNLQLMIKAGGNGYGNTDNFASLLILVIPIVAGLCYLGRRFWVMWGVLAFLCYAGLLVYSRSSIIAIILAIGCLWLYRLLVHRSMSAGLINFIAIFIFIHANPEMMRYHRDGLASFVQGAFPPSREASHPPGSNYPESATADKAGIDWDASGTHREVSEIA